MVCSVAIDRSRARDGYVVSLIGKDETCVFLPWQVFGYYVLDVLPVGIVVDIGRSQ